MVFKGIIAELRTRPRDERHFVAIFSAVLIMVALFTLWLFLFGLDVRNDSAARDTAEREYGATQSSQDQAASAAAALRDISAQTLTSDINAQIPADYITPEQSTAGNAPTPELSPETTFEPVPTPSAPVQGQSAAADLQSALRF